MDYQEKLVSCVTPVYNGERYLGQMLDSILGQTYPQMEMILVDDGSTDGTLEIAESYREKFAGRGYRYELVGAPHKNAAAAINRGLALAAGEYLIWPDSDDVLEPDSVKRRVDFLENHPKYQCVRSLMYYFDSDGGAPKARETIGDLNRERLFFDIMNRATFVCCGCYMLKTKEFFSIYRDRHIAETPVGQNFQMLLPYMYQHRCATIPEKLYGVRVRGDSHSVRERTLGEEEERYRLFEDLLDEIAGICGITSFYGRRQITCWKWKHRRNLALRHGKRLEAAKYGAALFLYGRSGLHRFLFGFVRRRMVLRERALEQ